MAVTKTKVANLKAAQTGDRRKALEVLRDTLAAAIDEAGPNVVSNISGQYRATLAELAEAAPAKGSRRDEFTARREARIAAAEVASSAVKAKRKRRV